MSTKTLRKRIALATVAALGAGVLSLVTTTTAHAAVATNPNVDPSSTAVNPAATDGALNIVAKTSVTGAITDANAGDSVAATSVGLLAVGDIASGHTAGTTQTATLLSSGTIQVYTSSTTDGAMISVSGGYIAKSNATAANSTATSVGISATASTTFWAQVKPTSGSTSMVITLNTKNGATGSELVTGAKSGVLAGQVTVSVVAASAGGVVSPANTGIYYEAPGGTATTAITADDTTSGVGTSDWATKQTAYVYAKDAYGVALASGLVQASATNGAYVGIASGATTSPSTSSAYVTAAPGGVIVTVAAPSTKPVSTVVTVSYNGTVLGTKSFTFTGEVAKVTLSGAANGKLGGNTSNTATIAFADAAGNAVYTTANTPAYGLIADGTNYGNIVTAVSMTTNPASGTPGVVKFTCSNVTGKAAIAVKYTNLSGSVISSNSLPVTCSGAATNYSASYDKSSYKPGDIATLTITFKDSTGALANDGDLPAQTTYGTVATAGTSATISGPSSTNHYSDVLSNGVLTYKYAVDANDGSFTNPVKFPDVDARAVAAGLSASTVAPTLVVSSGSTSLNDVLKGIVSLIASINKQIAALAKLVTKKK